jgi:Zn-finger nucleic acid-binding protein
MEARPVFRTEIDLCPACGGVFLDPGEAEVQGVDTAVLFGDTKGAAEAVGPTNRPCPAHRIPMVRYRILGVAGRPVDIDRATCCGGVFLDAGEQGAFARAAQRAALLAGGQPAAAPLRAPSAPTERVRSASGAVFAMPADPPEAGPAAAGAAPRGRAEGPGGAPADPPEAGPAAAGAAPSGPAEGPDGAAVAGGAGPTSGATGRAAPAPTAPAEAPRPGTAADDFAALCRGIAARGRATADPGSPEAPPEPLRPTEATERRCPRCEGAYRADRTGGVEIDVCDACGSMFFDPGEIEAKGIATAALFGVGPEAAQDRGPSELACPACGEAMQVARITTLAGVLEVDRATCCGGLFLDGGEYDPLARAARVAEHAAADRRFVRDGEVVGEAAVTREVLESGAFTRATAAFVRGRVDSMVMRMAQRRRRATSGTTRWDY